MKVINKIDIDLETFRILLHGNNGGDSLAIHFDKPSRRFYFSLIALIVINMQHQDKPGFVYLRKHEALLRRLDKALAGRYASRSIDNMWEKIRKAWHYTLTDLESAAHFKIENRDLSPPFEKGGTTAMSVRKKSVIFGRACLRLTISPTSGASSSPSTT